MEGSAGKTCTGNTRKTPGSLIGSNQAGIAAASNPERPPGDQRSSTLPLGASGGRVGEQNCFAWY